MDFEKEKEETGGTGGALVSETVFKGRPVLVLKKTAEDAYPLSFGMAKAKLIIDNYSAIEAFVKKHDKG